MEKAFLGSVMTPKDLAFGVYVWACLHNELPLEFLRKSVSEA